MRIRTAVLSGLSLFFALLLAPIASFGGADDERSEKEPVLHLTLQKAIELALAKNFQLRVQSYSPLIAEQRITQQWGAFDPTFSAGYARDEDTFRRSEPSSITQHDAVNAGISGLTPWGLSYNLGSNVRDTRLSTGS